MSATAETTPAGRRARVIGYRRPRAGRSTSAAGGGSARPLAVAVGLAALSLVVVAPAPSYDPWAWLLWGREVAELRLSTAEGPAFKPLPVAVCGLLAGLGDTIAPAAWVLLARTAAALALLASFDLARRLSDGSRAAGIIAATGVALTGAFLDQAASGLSEPALVALALAGVASARAGHGRAALACGAACALIRVETWPFLLVAGALAWRRRPRLRLAVALVAALVPLAWFGPELLGSGDLLRSGARARIPNPGQPALAAVPALASLREALALIPWPLWLGVGALAAAAMRTGRRRRASLPALAPASAGAAWLALVAVMAQAGFSGEPRYALPGAALISISGAVGVAALLRAVAPRMPAALAVVLVVAPIAGDRGPDLGRTVSAQAHHWKLSTGLRDAIADAGGRRAVLACGTPYVGPYRGTLAAYQLDVRKRDVEPDLPPRVPGVILRSRLRTDSPLEPEAPAGFATIGASGSWRVSAACDRVAPALIRVP